MKTFFRKTALSFVAMLCGWIACNIAWWLGALPSLGPVTIKMDDVMGIGALTGIVVLMTWLALFLPVDLCTKHHSKLRRPPVAGLFGFLAALYVVAAVFGYFVWLQSMRHGLLESIWLCLHVEALPYVLGTCAAGSTAAFVRALMDHPEARTDS